MKCWYEVLDYITIPTNKLIPSV